MGTGIGKKRLFFIKSFMDCGALHGEQERDIYGTTINSLILNDLIFDMLL